MIQLYLQFDYTEISRFPIYMLLFPIIGSYIFCFEYWSELFKPAIIDLSVEFSKLFIKPNKVIYFCLNDITYLILILLFRGIFSIIFWILLAPFFLIFVIFLILMEF